MFLEEDEYCLDIFEAILNIRKIENIAVSVLIPNPNFEFARYKIYPFDKPYSPFQFINGKTPSCEILKKLYNDRINPYLTDFILKY